MIINEIDTYAHIFSQKRSIFLEVSLLQNEEDDGIWIVVIFWSRTLNG